MAVASALAVGSSAVKAADCGSLAGKAFGAATITAATNVSPPSRVLSKNPPAPVEVKAPFCRVEGVIKPTSDSNIVFEVWLPPEAAWNGKFEGVGNGGFAGSLDYIPMNWALEAAPDMTGNPSEGKHLC